MEKSFKFVKKIDGTESSYVGVIDYDGSLNLFVTSDYWTLSRYVNRTEETKDRLFKDVLKCTNIYMIKDNQILIEETNMMRLTSLINFISAGF